MEKHSLSNEKPINNVNEFQVNKPEFLKTPQGSIEEAIKAVELIEHTVSEELGDNPNSDDFNLAIDEALGDYINHFNDSDETSEGSYTAIEAGLLHLAVSSENKNIKHKDDVSKAILKSQWPLATNALTSVLPSLPERVSENILDTLTEIRRQEDLGNYEEVQIVEGPHSLNEMNSGWEQLIEPDNFELSREERAKQAQQWIDSLPEVVNESDDLYSNLYLYEDEPFYSNRAIDTPPPPEIASSVLEILVNDRMSGVEDDTIRMIADITPKLDAELLDFHGDYRHKQLLMREYPEKFTDIKDHLESRYTDSKTGEENFYSKYETLIENPYKFNIVALNVPELLTESFGKEIASRRAVQDVQYRQNIKSVADADGMILMALSTDSYSKEVEKFAELSISDHPEEEQEAFMFASSYLISMGLIEQGSADRAIEKSLGLSRALRVQSEKVVEESSLSDHIKNIIIKNSPMIGEAVKVVERANIELYPSPIKSRLMSVIENGYNANELSDRIDYYDDLSKLLKENDLTMEEVSQRLQSSLEDSSQSRGLKYLTEYNDNISATEKLYRLDLIDQEIDVFEGVELTVRQRQDMRRDFADLLLNSEDSSGVDRRIEWAKEMTRSDSVVHSPLLRSIQNDILKKSVIEPSSEEDHKKYVDYISNISELANSPEGLRLFGDESVLVDQRDIMLQFMMEESNPEEWLKKTEALVSSSDGDVVFGPASPFWSRRSNFLQMILGHKSPKELLKSFAMLAEGNNALWYLNANLAQNMLGEVQEGSLSGYGVKSLPVAMPISSRSEWLAEDEKLMKPLADMDETELSWHMPEDAVKKVSSTGRIDFNSLYAQTRADLLTIRLFEGINKSRNKEGQGLNDTINRQNLDPNEILSGETLVHATRSVVTFRQILTNGLACGEAIGIKGRKDRYPWNVDTVSINREKQDSSFQEKVDSLGNDHYGAIAITLRRDESSTDYAEQTSGGYSENHELIFGAVPSTEISSVIMRDATEAQKLDTVHAVVDHGMYIPVFDYDGSILLTPQQYDEMRVDGNYDAAVPIYADQAVRYEDSQKGSNEGAWFSISHKNEIKEWYVKFGDMSAEKTNHLWTEYLADKFYKTVTPDLVPDTQIMVIEGRISRAALKVDLDEQATVTNEARNAGAIMDMYLGNWDAVYNSNNLIMTTDGRAMRIDTGNSFDFRARGARKRDEDFGGVVAEVDYGEDSERLGGGMRQKYPGLTDEQIKNQVRTLSEFLTDDKIDELIDSVRRSSGDRDRLKVIMKARRDDLVERFL